MGLGAYDFGWIYAAQEVDSPLVKIGYTGNVAQRIASLQRTYCVRLILRGAVSTSMPYPVEQRLHALLTAARIEGEWFYLHINQPTLERLVARAERSLSRIEESHYNTDLREFKRLARALWVTTDHLLCMDITDDTSERMPTAVA